jgi:hypothetical protein
MLREILFLSNAYGRKATIRLEPEEHVFPLRRNAQRRSRDHEGFLDLQPYSGELDK